MKKLLLKRWLIVFSLGLLSGPLARTQSSGPRTAVSLDGATGYAQAPNGVWFGGDFTLHRRPAIPKVSTASARLDGTDPAR